LQNQIRAKNGSILVTEDWAGAVYRISYSKKYGLSRLIKRESITKPPALPSVSRHLNSNTL
jgi:hypothetical protein